MYKRNKNEWVFKYIKEKTEKICIELIIKDPYKLMYIENQTEGICLWAILIRPDTFKYVRTQTERLCLIALMRDISLLEYVKKQTDEICRYALKKNKRSIIYIKDKEKYLEEFDIKYFKKQGKAREVIAIKENEEWLFTVGCQYKITKETFIDRIYNEGGGFDLEKGINVHRQTYLNSLINKKAI
ncbi:MULTISPECIES: hypothetical protein [unclassified Clostridioides]|uniref:hypothetical protein n=1 Tax=unclassified Clostridioides TaxID=2635829 RepID=UPI001D126521